MSRSLGSLKVVGLEKRFGDWTLRAQFEVHPGERAILWGKSGLGKTTLLHWIAGLLSVSREDRGRVYLGEDDLTFQVSQKRGVGIVFQDQALFGNLSVMENAEFGLKVRGVPQEERRTHVNDWLKRVGLESKSERKAHQLSIGERQRVAFIRAVCWYPRLILLDEPFAALDGETKAILRHELLELHQLCPAPLILVTHDEKEAQVLGQTRLLFQVDPRDASRSVTRELTNGVGFD